MRILFAAVELASVLFTCGSVEFVAAGCSCILVVLKVDKYLNWVFNNP
jgi:hypothetical protein